MSAAVYPPAIEYTIAVTGYAGKTFRNDRYRAYYSPDDGKLAVDPISSEQAARPVTPHGANLRITFQISFSPHAGGQSETASVPAGNPEASPDLIGVPLLSPTYMFGMRYQRAASPAPASGAPKLRTIAVVGVGKPNYSVSLLGITPLGGTQTYELQFTPLRDPKTNRLRMLWVGTNDYLPRKAIVAGNFTITPLVDVPWTVDFAVENGVPFITAERPDQTLFMPHRHTVRDASITFEDVRTPGAGEILPRGPLISQTPTSTSLVEP